MNKQKFDDKCKALYAHEDDMLAQMQEYIKPYNEELNKIGLKAECRLLWLYPDEVDEDKMLLTSRREIYRKRPYACEMYIGIGSIDFDFDNDEEDDNGITISEIFSAYSLTIWRGWAFTKCDCKLLRKEFDKIYPDVKNFGIEYVKKKYKFRTY
ncbi:MAG: hypothetical protein K2J01_02145 [Clostridiales bacterium]|nr:hypothetical protein [Clostridiales bacterium]